jgi:hypothetical protein
MALTRACGAECGQGAEPTASVQRHWHFNGTPSIDTAIKRTGLRSFKFAATGTAVNGEKTPGGTGDKFVQRFYVYFDTLPSVATTIWTATYAVGNSPSIRYNPIGTKIESAWETPAGGTEINPDWWYGIDVYLDTSANPHVFKWHIDDQEGAFEQQVVQAATTFNAKVGICNNVTATVYMDDYADSETLADYPIGLGKVIRLLPDSDGTHAQGAGAFVDASAIAISGGNPAWDNLDSGDVMQQTEYVRQTVTDTSGYIEVGFASTPETMDARMVELVAGMSSDGTNANTSKVVVNDGGTLIDAWPASDFSDLTQSYPHKAMAVPPSGGTWTPAKVNALKARFGYGGSIPAAPRCTAMLLEVEYPIVLHYHVGNHIPPAVFTRGAALYATSAEAETACQTYMADRPLQTFVQEVGNLVWISDEEHVYVDACQESHG